MVYHSDLYNNSDESNDEEIASFDETYLGQICTKVWVVIA